MTSLSLSVDDTPSTPSLEKLLAAIGSLPHLCTLKLLHGKPCCERAALRCAQCSSYLAPNTLQTMCFGTANAQYWYGICSVMLAA